MFALMSYNRIRTLELIKKGLYDINVGKIKEHKTKSKSNSNSKSNMSGGYIHKMNDVHEFGHPSSGGPLIWHDIDRLMKM
jgi:hypothetical protein